MGLALLTLLLVNAQNSGVLICDDRGLVIHKVSNSYISPTVYHLPVPVLNFTPACNNIIIVCHYIRQRSMH